MRRADVAFHPYCLNPNEQHGHPKAAAPPLPWSLLSFLLQSDTETCSISIFAITGVVAAMVNESRLK